LLEGMKTSIEDLRLKTARELQGMGLTWPMPVILFRMEATESETDADIFTMLRDYEEDEVLETLIEREFQIHRQGMVLH
jgi:hypothetical protein